MPSVKHLYPSFNAYNYSSLCFALYKPCCNAPCPRYSTTLMSHNHESLPKNASNLDGPRVPNQPGHHCHENGAALVDFSSTQQGHQSLGKCVGDFLTAIQTYQLEFDVENPLGRLPTCFVREFGEALSDYVILRDPNHNEFEVHVVKRLGEMYFGDGWHSLKDVYDIMFGAWVTIVYISPTLLTIRVLTRWFFEISYPSFDPPLRHLLARSDPQCKIGSSVMNIWLEDSVRPKSLIKSYVKDLTLYDVHSGVLVLPWYGFGESAFAFVFSDLILVDNAGSQYKCNVNVAVECASELSCNVSGRWRDLCLAHNVVEGDRVKFSVAHYSASNVMYVSIYPRIRMGDYLKVSALNN